MIKTCPIWTRLRRREMSKEVEAYKKKLAKMNKDQFIREWDRVMKKLNPNRNVRVTSSDTKGVV